MTISLYFAIMLVVAIFLGGAILGMSAAWVILLPYVREHGIRHKWRMNEIRWRMFHLSCKYRDRGMTKRAAELQRLACDRDYLDRQATREEFNFPHITS